MLEALKNSQTRLKLIFITPAASFILIFFVLPLLIVTAVSFTTAAPNGGIEWTFSLESYQTALSPEKNYLQVFARSFRIAAITTLLSFLVGYPMAFFIATRPPRWRESLMIALMIPFWTNLVIRAYAWLLIIRPGGLVNTALINAGLLEKPILFHGTEMAVIMVLLYTWLPNMVLPSYAAIDRLDKRIIEAAYDLYAGDFQVFTRVILPLTTPGIAAGGILVFIPALGAFIEPLIIGGGKVAVIGIVLEREFQAARNWPLGSALSVGLSVLMLLGTLAYFRLTRERIDTGQRV